MPNIDIPSGTYTETKYVTLTAETGAKIYYTLDGTEPTQESILYEEKIEIAKGDSTLKAVAYADGKESSGIATAEYHIIDPTDIVKLQEDQPATFAIYSTEGEAGLPKTLKAVTADNNNKDDAEVIWNTNGVTLNTEYTEQHIKGSMAGGFEVDATVVVIPNNIKMFIDCGAIPAQDSTYDSELFYAIRDKLGNELINNKADQSYDKETGWGYTGKVGDPNSDDMACYGLHSGNDFKSSGWWGNGDRKMPYQVHLKAGTYIIHSGHQEWWGATRNMKLEVTYDGLENALVEDIYVDKNAPETIGKIEIVLEEEKDVTISVYGSGAVLSWLAVEERETTPDDIVSLAEGQKTNFAVYDEEGIEGLPETLKVVTRAGDVKDVKV